MGFGLLFIGYFLEYLIGMNQIGALTHIIGYLVMFVGLARLRLYCHTFSYAMYCTIPLTILAIYRTFAGLPELWDVSFSFVTPARTLVVDTVDVGLMTLYHVLLMVAIVEICRRTDVKKNAIRAMQNLLIVVLYAGAHSYFSFNSSDLSGPFFGVVLLLRLIWVICNLVLIGSCYMRICPAGEESMDQPIKLSRIGWIARLQQKYQKSEDKAINADRAYHQQRYDEQVNKLNAARGNQRAQHSRAAKRAEIEAAREAARRRRERDE